MALFQQRESSASESPEKSERRRRVEERVDRVTERTPMSTGDPVAAAAAASVLLAWYQFYAKGNKETGIFVGLWAPTLLAAASYLQQKDIVRKFKRGLSSF
ncbi:hypothetical protein [Haloarchaeobius sp. HRN-SO-5]|uniref:hypothetical protein n=1 Tax=Haloarchaeobius sp. HRN-SO-5 TaxID=3446118 RepID=UPI003EBCF965